MLSKLPLFFPASLYGHWCMCMHVCAKAEGGGSLRMELQEWQQVEQVESDVFSIGLTHRKLKGRTSAELCELLPSEQHSVA